MKRCMAIELEVVPMTFPNVDGLGDFSTRPAALVEMTVWRYCGSGWVPDCERVRRSFDSTAFAQDDITRL